jgi:hypothetical protein
MPGRVISCVLAAARVAAIALLAATALITATAREAAAQGPPDNLPGVGPVALEGELDVIYEDDEDRGEARLRHFLKVDNRRVPLRFRDGDAPDLPTGARVRVTGDLAEGSITTTSVTTLATSASRTMGPQDILVILFNFSNNASQSFSATTISSVNDQVRRFYLENTYGQTLLSFTVVGWYTIGATDATCDYTTWASQAEAKATNAGVNLNAYDRRVFAFPRAAACAWTGMGNLAGPRSWANGSYTVRTIAHEQGHNFGDHHSKAQPCASGTCSVVEYGDDRDILGVSGRVAHMNAFQKERLGWLNYGTSPAIGTVSGSGDFWIDNYETLSGSMKALKIWNPAKSAYYYIESRAQVGFDGNVAPGVTLHSGVSGISYQVDLDPNSTTYDSTLDIGQVFSDGAIGLSVQTLSTSVDGALIRVSVSGPPCTVQAPSIAVSATSQLKYTVTVKNNNSSGCAGSAFNLSAALPAGWTGSFSPASSATLSPGASASTTLSLVAPAGTDGTYQFSVTAVDASTGQQASATASASLATSLAVMASATLTSEKGNNRSATIAVSVKAGTAPAAGASVVVTVTSPQGTKSSFNASAGSDGSAIVKMMLKTRDVSGTYQVAVNASSAGASGSATTSFVNP